MSDGPKAGITAALAVTGPGEPPAAPEQLALPVAAPPAEAARGPGRPPGAKNRRTVEWVEYLVGKYGSPLEGLLKEATAELRELARDLGMSTEDAAKHRKDCMIAALPYIHQKLPLAIDVKGKVVTLHLHSAIGGPETIEGELEQLIGDGLDMVPVDQDPPDGENSGNSNG